MPGWLHAALLVAYGAALGVAIIAAARAFEPPARAQALRRIERLNHLAHRPLSSLQDGPAGSPGPAGRMLWRVHQARLRARLGALRAGWPSPQLMRHDPLGLRAAIGLVLIIAVVAAGGDWPERLARAFSPGFAEARVALSLEAWITPPDYTGVAPIFLSANPVGDPADQSSVSVPAASRLMVRVHTPAERPRLRLDGRFHDLEALDDGNDSDFEIERGLDRSAVASVVAGSRTLASWPIRVIADAPPVIGFANPPGPTLRKALKITYRATDDYGVERAVLRLVLAEKAGDDADDKALSLPLLVTAGGPRQVAATAYHDLTAHPWAGMNVRATLVAWDALDQPGTSQPLTLRLPERGFAHPVAREVVAARKHLLANPEAGAVVAMELEAIARRPDRFGDDAVVYMGLRVAYWRLIRQSDQDPDPDAGPVAGDAVIDLLWDLALRIEDGDRLLAERDLRAALEALEAALENQAPADQIERLTDQVQAALGRYLQALAEQARDQDLAPSTPPGAGSQMPGAASQIIGSETLQQMLEQLRDLNRLGARGAAKDLLSDLRNILENLRTGSGGQAQSGQARALSEALRGIDQVMRDQRQVIEQTEDVAIDRGSGQAEDANRAAADAVGRRQQGLRQRLGQALEGLGRAGSQVPGAMDRADRAMGEAGEALKRGNLGTALQRESAALEALREGAGEIAQALAQAAAGGVAGLGGSAVDPLGRPLGTANAGDEGLIPRQLETRRARQILEELRRRANQQRRSREERDYIERLLKRF